MSKMIAGIGFMYLVITVLAAALNGGGGVNATYLTQNASPTQTTIYVADTTGFLSADYIVIDGEKIAYTGTTATSFTGCHFANVHTVGPADDPKMVYSPSTSLVNQALGFNVGAITSTVGPFAIITVPLKFFTSTLPNLVTGNLLPGLDGTLAIFGYIWLFITLGIVVSLGIAMLWVASSLVR